MGTAEVGRELGDAGGPLLVGAVAAALTLSWGLAALALILGSIALISGRRTDSPTGSPGWCIRSAPAVPTNRS
ncbi:hypothetical protein [Nakamurella sp.]|uniref:hypothetical protein n=1 Tax=Nakamurella sp. TaxID=1869182 RepID=UPI00378463FA